jgi:hypothetical protein
MTFVSVLLCLYVFRVSSIISRKRGKNGEKEEEEKKEVLSQRLKLASKVRTREEEPVTSSRQIRKRDYQSFCIEAKNEFPF